MEQPNPHLGGLRPIELIETQAGAQQILDYIRHWLAQQSLDGE
jgi:6-hydroxy-3-succinoylpyridine 3-monooxygenase